MLRCCECGKRFYEEDADTFRESRGEFWGSPCYETLLCCPCCGSDELEECSEDEEDEEE